jgi:sec-independent protein translocase protein TatC
MTGPGGTMSLLDHLEELRSRLILCLGVILALSVVGYYFSDGLLAFLTRPVGKVYFMGVAEAFAVKIKISLFFGVFAGSPVVFYQAWRFVMPGLSSREVLWVLPVALAMFVFFMIGAAFCFYLVLPVGVEFLMGFQTDTLVPLISVSKYVSFVGWMTLAFGLVFELPVVTFILGRLGFVSAAALRQHRKLAIVVILVVAAIATPSPDAFSQLLLAGPLYLLYELSVILVALTGRSRGIPSQESASDP